MPEAPVKGAAAGPLLIRRDTQLHSKQDAGPQAAGGGSPLRSIGSPRSIGRGSLASGFDSSFVSSRGRAQARLHSSHSSRRSHSRGRSPKRDEGLERDMANEDGGPKTEKGRIFKKLQEEIREGVERADHALLAYEVKDDAIRKLEQVHEAARPTEAQATPLPENLDDIVPAAEQMAKLRLNMEHEESMRRLVGMYNSLKDDQTGLFAPPSSVPDEEDAFALLDSVAAHRDEVIQKVEVMRKKAIETQLQGGGKIARTESGRIVRVSEQEFDHLHPGDSKGDVDSHVALKELVVLHEKKIENLEAELDEENRVREAMLEDKDGMIAQLKKKLEVQNREMSTLLKKTANELASSAEHVEDTRVHIAYLSIQLRNAKELAASREFDADKWVLKEDYDALQDEVEVYKANQKKMEARFVLENELTQKAYAYAKQVQRAKEQADEVHAHFELQLRGMLQERDKDLVKLNYESRLLHHRADKMVGEMEQKRVEMAKAVQEEIDKAQQAMEEQRAAFNVALQEKDDRIATLGQDVLNLTIKKDHADAIVQELRNEIAAMKQAVIDKRNALIHTPTQLEWQQVLDPLSGNSDAGGGSIKPDKGTQTSDIKVSLWRVARRSVAIQALSLLDRRADAVRKAEWSIKALEAEFEVQRGAAEKKVSDAIAKVREREQEVVLLAARLRAMVKSLRAEKSRLKASDSLATGVSNAMSICVRRLHPLIRASVDGDPAMAEAFLAEEKGGEVKPLISMRREEDKGDLAEMDEIDNKLTHIVTQQDQGSDLGRNLVAVIQETLGGVTAKQMSDARLFLEQETQLRRQDEIPTLQAALAVVGADKTIDEARSVPRTSKDVALIETHRRNGNLLDEILQRWDRNRADWLRERKRLRLEIDEAAQDAQGSFNKELLAISAHAAGGGRAPSTREQPTADHSDSLAMELMLYKQVHEGLEAAMDEVTKAALDWHENEVGVRYQPAPPPAVEGLPAIVGKSVLLVQACCLTLLGAVEASNKLNDLPETVSRGNTPIPIPAGEQTQMVYYKNEEVGLVSTAPTPDPDEIDLPGESKPELKERVKELQGELDALRLRLSEAEEAERKFKKERVALRLMRCNMEGMEHTLKSREVEVKQIKEQKDALEAKAAGLEAQATAADASRTSKEQEAASEGDNQVASDASRAKEQKPAREEDQYVISGIVKMSDIESDPSSILGLERTESGMSSLAQFLAVRRAAAKVVAWVRKIRDRKSRETGGDDLDVHDLARQAARMRAQFEDALWRESERIKVLKKSSGELQEELKGLKRAIKDQKEAFDKEREELSRTPQTKHRLIQTDDWEPEVRGETPGTVAMKIEEARLEVRAQWENRLKAAEVSLKTVKEEAHRDLEREKEKFTRVTQELNELEEEMKEQEEKMVQVKTMMEKNPLEALVKSAKDELTAIHKQAAELSKLVWAFQGMAEGEGKKQHTAIKGQADGLAGTIANLQRMLEGQSKIEVDWRGGKMSKSQRRRAAMEGTKEDRPRTGESAAEAARKLLKLIDEDFEDISDTNKGVSRAMAGRPKRTPSPPIIAPVPPLPLSKMVVPNPPAPRAAVSQRSRPAPRKEAWREGDQVLLPPLPFLPASRGSSRGGDTSPRKGGAGGDTPARKGGGGKSGASTAR